MQGHVPVSCFLSAVRLKQLQTCGPLTCLKLQPVQSAFQRLIPRARAERNVLHSPLSSSPPPTIPPRPLMQLSKPSPPSHPLHLNEKNLAKRVYTIYGRQRPRGMLDGRKRTLNPLAGYLQYQQIKAMGARGAQLSGLRGILVVRAPAA